MSETGSIERKRIEAFLSSPQFVRLCEVFETYQRVLQESKKDIEQQEIIKERMNEIFGEREDVVKDAVENEDPEALGKLEKDQMRRQLLEWAESGKITKEKMADLFAHFSLADKMLEEFNQKPGEYVMGGGEGLLLNEAVSYKEDGEYVNLHIIPAPTKGTAELVQKIIEGFNKLAQEMKSGKLTHIKNVGMFSWLLGPAFADKIKLLLGDDINIQEPDEEEKDSVENVQRMALTYNKRAMEDYLKTGQKPPVRKIWLTREEFLKKFGT